MSTEKAEDQVMEQTLNEFLLRASQCNTEADIHKLAENMAIIGISVMRGTMGEEFVKGFLLSAINEKNPLVIQPKKAVLN